MIAFISCNNPGMKYDFAIGKIFREIKEIPQFTNYEEVQAALLEPLNGVDFAVKELRNGDTVVLLFEKLHPLVNINKFEILDVLEITSINEDDLICFQSCQKDSLRDSEIVAITKYDENLEYFKDIIQAWRADRENGKFISIDPKGIECLNEGFGAD